PTLIITGGEPLLQQDALRLFIIELQSLVKFKIYIEIETNGTIIVDPLFGKLISQFNVSPKLKNSGMPSYQRIQPKAIFSLLVQNNTYFKFVVKDEQEILDEIFLDFIAPFGLLRRNIYLMPACDNREDLREVSLSVVEICKKYGFNFSSR